MAYKSFIELKKALEEKHEDKKRSSKTRTKVINEKEIARNNPKKEDGKRVHKDSVLVVKSGTSDNSKRIEIRNPNSSAANLHYADLPESTRRLLTLCRNIEYPIYHKYLGYVRIKSFSNDSFNIKTDNGDRSAYYNEIGTLITLPDNSSLSSHRKKILDERAKSSIQNLENDVTQSSSQIIDSVSKNTAASENVLTEERAHLKDTVDTIDKTITDLRKKLGTSKEVLSTKKTGNREDNADFRLSLGAVSLAKGDLELYESMRPEPYFARMDFDIQSGGRQISENFKCYIGMATLDSQSVFDWRSPVGMAFYQDTINSFVFNEFNYILKLRRRFQIKDSELISLETTYDSYSSDTSKGSVADDSERIIDPFLIGIIKRKREDKKLTTIIQSIQNNQINIIRQPYDMNFVVQGCAGSGKTMILLHRLSFIKFNNPKINWSGVKIITPNNLFGGFISDVAKKLELDNIAKLTVEGYYASLINKYNEAIDAPAEADSEYALNKDFLQSVYSAEFSGQCKDIINKFGNTMTDNLLELKLDKNFKDYIYKFKYPVNDKNYNKFSSNVAASFKSLQSEANDRIRASRKANLDLEEELMALEAFNYDYRSLLADSKEKALKAVRNKHTVLQGNIASFEEQVAALSEQIEKITTSIKEEKEKLLKLSSSGKSLTEVDPRTIDFSVIKDKKLAESVRADCIKYYEKILSLKEQHAKLPAENFTKRRRIGSEIIAVQKLYREAISTVETELAVMNTDSISESSELITELNEKSEGLKRQITVLEQKIKDTKAHIKPLKFSISKLEDTLSSSVKELINQYPEDLEDLLRGYQINFEYYTSKEAELKALNNRIAKAKVTVKDCYSRIPNASQKSLLKTAGEIIEQFNIDTCIGLIEDEIRKLDGYSKEYSGNYRYKLYLRLLACREFYGPIINPDIWVSIDEAQDISVSEYGLIRDVLGHKCAINLYGDINQLVYDYKGIDDWSDIEFITSKNKYILNENYRNTVEITEFSNKQLGAEILPIGINGRDVIAWSEEDSDAAINAIAIYKQQHPVDRTVILYKSTSDRTVSVLKKHPRLKSASWHRLDPKQISVLTVEEAKGLEFDAVTVFTDGMRFEDEYISYTRALDNLSVVGSNGNLEDYCEDYALPIGENYVPDEPESELTNKVVTTEIKSNSIADYSDNTAPAWINLDLKNRIIKIHFIETPDYILKNILGYAKWKCRENNKCWEKSDTKRNRSEAIEIVKEYLRNK